jgi:hypothetical protein
MASKTSTTSNIRPALRKTYLYVVDNWAVGTGELKDKGLDIRHAKKLERDGLLATTHVNDERELTWQSYFDIANEDNRADAVAAFDAVYPKGQPVNSGGGRGGYGPRYTKAQIRKGQTARRKGLSRKQVAAAAGVKSPNYFSRLLAKLEEEGK